MTQLHQHYNSIRSKMATDLTIGNINAVPKMDKIVINMGWGDIKGNEALQKIIEENLRTKNKKKPIVTRAKKSIAGFKIREGDQMGYKITLRGDRMYGFLSRLVTYVFPRLRDFHGMPTTGFDRHGNYSFGFRDLSVFPEVPFGTAARSGSLQVTIVTTSTSDEGAQALLQELGFPFVKPKPEVK